MVRPVSFKGFQKGFQGVSLRGFREFQIFLWELCVCIKYLSLGDPCMGSGHILVYTFEVLMEIYRSVGYTDRDAAASIVENNLYGLDIDDRAAQLAYFAVMMKAREYDRRFLRRGVQPHVCAVQESAALPDETLAALGAERPLAERLLKIFADAKEYGSLVHVDLTLAELERLDTRLAELETAAPASLLTMADSARNAAGKAGENSRPPIRRSDYQPAVHGRQRHERQTIEIRKRQLSGQQERPVCVLYRALR